MALARNAGPAYIPSREAEYREIEDWYRDLLARTPPPAHVEPQWFRDLMAREHPPDDASWEPIRIGPTWQWDNGWVLPEATLGWNRLAWCGYWLNGKGRKPWVFTPEQARFILWRDALDSNGDFLYHSAVLQRLKGWGKDPLAATIAASSLHADIVFDHWDGGRPVGHDEPDAWTQVIAVSQDQTKNTMKLFPSLISVEAQRHYGIQIGKLNVWSDSDRRQIEAVTASPGAIEGGRPKEIIRNETQNWNASNGGHDMAGAIEGNAAKAELSNPARMLDICNAYKPDEDSVAQRAREGWEKTQGDDPEYEDYGLLYDSIEAPPVAPLTSAAAAEVVVAIAGDADWLDTRPNGRIIKSILNPNNSPSESRRKWYNQVGAAEDARFDPHKTRACATAETLQPGDEIALFGDGSKSDDATALVGVRISDGLTQLLHIQQPKRGELVDRGKVRSAVGEIFRTYKVAAFWFDPSHAKDESDQEDERFWWPVCDDWHATHGRKLKPYWAVKTGDRQHAVAWDMTSHVRLEMFTKAVEQLAADIRDGSFKFHRPGGAQSNWLQRHLLAAKDASNKYGVSMRKDKPDSPKKIDAAVCAAGARMLRRIVQLERAANSKRAPGTGRVIAMD